jgi:hypothetical protein
MRVKPATDDTIEIVSMSTENGTGILGDLVLLDDYKEKYLNAFSYINGNNIQ